MKFQFRLANIRRFFLSGLLLTLLGACATEMPSRELPDLTFSHLTPLKLDVTGIDTVSKFTSPLKAPNVEHTLPVSPAKAVTRWVGDRLVPSGVVGKSGIAIFTIDNAAVTETQLKVKSGLKGAFYKEQSERYDAKLEGTLEIFDLSGRTAGFATAKVSRSLSIREDISLTEREKVWFALVENLMKDFNAEMEQNIRRYLVNWLR